MPLSAYRQHLQQGVDSGAYTQIAAGWLDGGERQLWFFGHDTKPDAASTFEIGAATEVFTGLLLAQAAYESKLRLQAPIRELLPKDFAWADPMLGSIRLQDLATHRAGLPALPPNLLPANADDPYADFSARDLQAFLTHYRRSDVAAAGYSALDAGLLGYLLGRAYAQDYRDLLREKVLKPLGMDNSGFDDSLSLLSGHNRDGKATHWHFGALAGAAGMRASAGDLLNFLQQNLQPQDSPVRAALLLSRQAQNGAQQDTGLGWNIVEVSENDQTWPLLWRASRTAGFATFMGFRTDHQQALVLLGSSDVDLSALGIAWLEQRTPPPLPELPPPPFKPASLDAYPGLYQVRGGFELVVRAAGAQLSAQVRGQPAQSLRPIGDDAFAGETFVLTFQREVGKVSGVLINAGGTHVQAPRLSEHAPGIPRTALAIEAKTLTDFAGDYRLDADTLLRIAVRGDALSQQLTGRAAVPLIAFAKDRFADAQGSCEITFQRDDKGLVDRLVLDLAGIDRSAPRVNWTAPPQ